MFGSSYGCTELTFHFRDFGLYDCGCVGGDVVCCLLKKTIYAITESNKRQIKQAISISREE
jgi:hypothetical protein